MPVTIIVNGVSREVPDAGDGFDAGEDTLLAVLRDRLGVTGPKLGCGEGACGACTVLIGRRAVAACQVPAAQAAGQRVTTAEGLAADGVLHPVQQAWLECGALQCGFCTPGWLTATAGLLDRVPRPDDARIAAELTNICRCGAYARIRQAVHRAAALLEDPEQLVPAPPPGPGAGGAPPPGPGAHAGRPWDLASGDPEGFAADMPEGLMTVVPGDTVPGPPGAARAGLGPNDAWVHVGADGAVTAYTGKVEAGQGTRAALGALVADGLAVPATSVSVVMGDTGLSPYDAGTFGSRSMPYAVPALRAAAAAARRLLTQEAARRFGLPSEVLRAAGGVIGGPDGAPSASYGELVAGQRRVEVASAAETLSAEGMAGAAVAGAAQSGELPPGAAQPGMSEVGTGPASAGQAGGQDLPGAGSAGPGRPGAAQAGAAQPAGPGAVMGSRPDGTGQAGEREHAAGVTPSMASSEDERAERLAAVTAGAAGAADAVTGAKLFPADLRVPGMLYGCVLRAPSHGATLVRADTSAAAAVPGVTVVTDGSFVGVAGVSRAAARRALGLVRAEWAGAPWDEPEPVTPAGLEAWLRSHPAGGSGPGGAFVHEDGEAAGGLAAGAVRRSARYDVAYIAHVPMEPRSALAVWEPGSGAGGDRLTVWSGTSTPFRARDELAAALGLPAAAVRVIVPDYGGGFGGKHGGAVAVDAARLARATGRPVHVQWTRQEEFQGSYLRPAAVIDVAGAAGPDGRLTGWSVTNINSGATGLVPPYRIGGVRAEFRPAVSPLPQGAYRALAATANNFARESLMDELAEAAGLDPVEFRLRNTGDERLAAVLRAAAAEIGWGRAAGGQRTSTGIALGKEKGGRVATAARVHVAADGAVRVLELVTAVDCGAVIFPDGLVNQVEGAVLMGLGGALLEAVDFRGGRIVNASLGAYRVPRLADLPDVRVVLLDQPGRRSAGGGEAPIIAVAPAIGNAIYRACGTRLRSMPMAPGGRVPPPGAG